MESSDGFQVVRCPCGKIVAEVGEDNKVRIKCRHCKRFILIELNQQGRMVIRYTEDPNHEVMITPPARR